MAKVSWMEYRKTRFPELVYGKLASANEWSFFATDTYSRVGPIYASKAELLADLTRYAKDSWGIE